MGNEIGLLFDEKKTIKINGKEFKIGKLKLMTVLRLVKLMGAVFTKMSKTGSAMKVGKTNAEDVINAFEMLDEEALVQAISIILETDDIAFCRTIDFSDFTDVIVALCENNDFNKIVGNVKRVTGLIQNHPAS